MAFKQFLVVFAILAAMVNAGAKDLCTQGSDSECARFGSNMCCAYINYTFKGDNQEFYACASRPGIEYSQGNIYDKYGFSGTWRCAFATGTQVAAIAFSAAILATLSF